MKKLSVLLMVLLFSVTLVFAQNEELLKERIKEVKKELNNKKEELKALNKSLRSFEGSEVGDRVKDSFITDFGNVADVKWQKEKNFDRAIFTKDGNELRAYYDFNSDLIGTTQDVDFADLPPKAQKEIQKEYKDYEIGEVVYYNDNEPVETNMFLYEEEFQHEDNYFVELIKDTKRIILRVNSFGSVYNYKEIK
jgi:hypothetical protein